MITRWSFSVSEKEGRYFGAHAESDSSGLWVLHQDHTREMAEQAAEIERLTRRNNELRTANGFAELEAEIERLRQTLRDLMDLAEYWFIKGAGRDMSESEYRNWRSMSYGSKAYQDAKQAALAAKGERCRQRNR